MDQKEDRLGAIEQSGARSTEEWVPSIRPFDLRGQSLSG
jgi:hypothetical protein